MMTAWSATTPTSARDWSGYLCLQMVGTGRAAEWKSSAYGETTQMARKSDLLSAVDKIDAAEVCQTH
jgi:hypothetical protein